MSRVSDYTDKGYPRLQRGKQIATNLGWLLVLLSIIEEDLWGNLREHEFAVRMVAQHEDV